MDYKRKGKLRLFYPQCQGSGHNFQSGDVTLVSNVDQLPAVAHDGAPLLRSLADAGEVARLQ